METMGALDPKTHVCAKMDESNETQSSALVPFEDADCVEVYLYRRKPSSIRNTARLFLEQSLALGKVDLDFPFQYLALCVGDHYYEATAKGPSLKYRHYHKRDRAQYGWLPESNYNRTRLGCTYLSHEEIHERGRYRRSSGTATCLMTMITNLCGYVAALARMIRKRLHKEDSTDCQEFVRALFDALKPEMHHQRDFPRHWLANARSVIELGQVLQGVSYHTPR